MTNFQNKEYISYKDPSSSIYEKNKTIYRQINKSYFEIYNLLKSKNVFNTLVKKDLLIPHTEIESKSDCIIIKPEKIHFISYPYEWCFSQLKAASLLTLKINYELLKLGFILKDASAYNVQFIGKKPIFIDSTSFEVYKEGNLWIAYKQFCEHFIAPLFLMKYVDSLSIKLLIHFIDGIPLTFASKLLPLKTYFKQLSLLHIHLHAKSIKKYENTEKQVNYTHLSQNKLLNLMEHLYEKIDNLKLKRKSNWTNYYETNTYDVKSQDEKLDFIIKCLDGKKFNYLLDIGCNDGYYSLQLADKLNYIISIDNDERVIDKLFQKSNNLNLLPLIIDISNPSPSIGLNNKERKSFIDRLESDNFTLALAVIHHLRFTYNIPLSLLAKSFSVFSKYIVIEFVSHDDIQVKKLLKNKKDVYTDYTEENFLTAFGQYFTLVEKHKLTGVNRTLYFFVKK